MNPTNNPERTLVTERLLAFTPQQIFAAFQNPEKLAQWWGPDGFTNSFDTFQFQPGGKWVFVMHGPDGTDYPNENVFSEIVPNSKIVIDHVYAPKFRLTVMLTPQGDHTLLTWEQCFETSNVLQSVRAICEPANEQNLNRLERVCATENQ